MLWERNRIELFGRTKPTTTLIAHLGSAGRSIHLLFRLNSSVAHSVAQLHPRSIIWPEHGLLKASYLIESVQQGVGRLRFQDRLFQPLTQPSAGWNVCSFISLLQVSLPVVVQQLHSGCTQPSNHWFSSLIRFPL